MSEGGGEVDGNMARTSMVHRNLDRARNTSMLSSTTVLPSVDRQLEYSVGADKFRNGISNDCITTQDMRRGDRDDSGGLDTEGGGDNDTDTQGTSKDDRGLDSVTNTTLSPPDRVVPSLIERLKDRDWLQMSLGRGMTVEIITPWGKMDLPIGVVDVLI